MNLDNEQRAKPIGFHFCDLSGFLIDVLSKPLNDFVEWVAFALSEEQIP
jgi:hypothetical protein